jgi:hypothetical protein
LLTRVTTQYLAPEDGDEQEALESVYIIFPLTREILRRHGSGSGEFAKLAIPVLNQMIRPFTAKWHRRSLSGAFKDSERCRDFRAELSALQPRLRDSILASPDPARRGTRRDKIDRARQLSSLAGATRRAVARPEHAPGFRSDN